MSSRSLKLLLVTALIAGLQPPAVVSAAGDGVHVLRGVSTFTATTTSKTLVRFPEPVKFSLENFVASYEGDGRIRGFILRRLGTYEQEGHRPVMQSVNIGQCETRGCKARKRHNFTFIVCFCNSRRLSGTWELYVLADGAPVTVTFKIKTLSGTTHVPVAGPVRSEIKTLEPRVHEDGTDTVFSAGDFTELNEANFGMVGLWVIGDPHSATAVGDCTYYPENRLTPPNEDVAFTPGCPLSDGYTHPWVDPDLGEGGMVFTSASQCCPVGVGGWYATAAAVKDYGAVALWIDY